MKVTTGASQRPGFAISDILELNDRASAGLDGQPETPPYPTHHDLVVPGQTILPPSSRHWAQLPQQHELGKYAIIFTIL